MDPITILVAQKLVALKGSYNCVISQFIAHNSIHTSQYTCISTFITYSQFESPFHNNNLYKRFITTWGVNVREKAKGLKPSFHCLRAMSISPSIDVFLHIPMVNICENESLTTYQNFMTIQRLTSLGS